MKLVFIHGRSQGGKDPVALQQTWEDSLDEGLANAGLSRPAGLEIAFPFYGDLLDDLIEQLEAPLVADVVERGAAQDDSEADFRGEFLAEIAAGSNLTEEDIRENFDADFAERGALNWKWVRAIIQTLDKSRRLGDLSLDQFTRDVYVYLTNPAVRRRIDGVVSPHVGGERCVVVGHSLGSVVGYNVLLDQTNPVVRYVTVGSPLAVKSVKRRLRSPLRMPPTTSSWYNAMDPDDIVALHPLEGAHFDITPPIVNHKDVVNTTDNQHGIVGYLPDPWVARAIHEALTA
ncbi:MAG: alpha/beta hydrolase [Acidobacteria bacterium]|nr:alpha/beta hydrolase [Acidobacteriota bacterium]